MFDQILYFINVSSLKVIADTSMAHFSHDPDFEEENGWDIIQSIDTEDQRVINELDEAFRTKLKPFPEIGEYKTIYCRLYKRKETRNGETFLFSALTKEMIEADRGYFNKERAIPSVIDLLYKPYFYEMSVKEIPDGIQEDTWYEVTVSIDGNNPEIPVKQYGRLSFAASPYIDKEVAINRWQELIKYDIQDFEVLKASDIVDASDTDIERELKHVFENVKSGTIQALKYGEANFIKSINVVGSTNREYIFDCGFPTEYCLKKDRNKNIDWNASEVLDDVAKIGKCKPELVFISHWHQDHYKAGFMFNRGVYMGQWPARWIVAHYDVNFDNDYSADRLVRYLIDSRKILFVRDNYAGCIVGNTRLVRGTRYSYAYNGKNKADLNNSCLMLQTGNTLLAGDCDFEFWPDDYGKRINSDITNVVIPHHAASTTNKAEAQNRISNIIPVVANRKTALVCVGYNDYKPSHPDGAVLQLYSDLGFDVSCTNNASVQTVINI